MSDKKLSSSNIFNNIYIKGILYLVSTGIIFKLTSYFYEYGFSIAFKYSHLLPTIDDMSIYSNGNIITLLICSTIILLSFYIIKFILKIKNNIKKIISVFYILILSLLLAYISLSLEKNQTRTLHTIINIISLISAVIASYVTNISYNYIKTSKKIKNNINNKDINNKDVINKDVINKDVINKDVINKDVNNDNPNNKDKMEKIFIILIILNIFFILASSSFIGKYIANNLTTQFKVLELNGKEHAVIREFKDRIILAPIKQNNKIDTDNIYMEKPDIFFGEKINIKNLEK